MIAESNTSGVIDLENACFGFWASEVHVSEYPDVKKTRLNSKCLQELDNCPGTCKRVKLTKENAKFAKVHATFMKTC